MTLHYYLPKAYEFVCNVLSLPHSSSIHTWAASVDCEPSYLTNVISLIRQLPQKKRWITDIVLVVDSMSLSRMTVYDWATKSFVGLVDCGSVIPEPEDAEATEALVFMVVGTTGHWKSPIAYVLQNKGAADVQTCLITDCIGLLYSHSINVLAVVFDGTFTNQQTALQLGCKIKVCDIQTWFPHPEVFFQHLFHICCL